MHFWINEEGLTKTLFLAISDPSEGRRLRDFAPYDEPLQAVLKKNVEYGDPYIEIKKKLKG